MTCQKYLRIDNHGPVREVMARLAGAVPVGKRNGFRNTLYILSCRDNVNVNDAVPLTVKGKGNYAGTVETTFAIVPADLSGFSVSVMGPTAYTDEPVEPSVSVSYGAFEVEPGFFVGGTSLVPGLEYTVTYENNVEKGEAVATVTGVGNYTGTATVTFTIE